MVSPAIEPGSDYGLYGVHQSGIPDSRRLDQTYPVIFGCSPGTLRQQAGHGGRDACRWRPDRPGNLGGLISQLSGMNVNTVSIASSARLPEPTRAMRGAKRRAATKNLLSDSSAKLPSGR